MVTQITNSALVVYAQKGKLELGCPPRVVILFKIRER